MDIFLNGEAHTAAEGQTLASLVDALELTGQAIAVAVNRQVVRRTQWQQCLLHADDKVDVVRAIGGG
jgi:sulfur carrier protein